jgi:stress response protein YsnF
MTFISLAQAAGRSETSAEEGTRQKRDVGALQAQGARRRDRQRMVVRHHTLAHRRTQQRDLFMSAPKQLRRKLRLCADSVKIHAD